MQAILSDANALFHGAIPALGMLSFALLMVFTAWNWKSIQSYFSGVDRRTWAAILGITLFAYIVRLVVPSPQHIMFTDEYDYMFTAKTFLQTHNVGEYHRSIAWPLVIAAFFRVFGVANQVAIHASTVLGALTVFVFFLLCHAITKKQAASLAAALIFAMLPHHVRWSACAETNVSSLMFIMAALVFCFVYFELRTARLLFLAAISLALASQFRPENILYAGLFACGCVIFKSQRRHSFWAWPAALALLAALALPNFIQVMIFETSTNWISSDTHGLSTGDNFSVYNLVFNSLRHGWELINPLFLPVPATVLAYLGLRRVKSHHRPVYQFLALWFGVLWLVYFSSWLHTMGGRVRVFMSFYPIFIVLACYGFERVSERLAARRAPGAQVPGFPKATAAVVLAVCALHLPIAYFSSSDTESRLETNVPQMAKADIPESCLVIANVPVALQATTDFTVLPASVFLNEPQVQDIVLSRFDCVLFYEDLTCFQHPLPECLEIKKRFALVPFRVYHDRKTILLRTKVEGYAKFSFYKITGRVE